MFDKALAAFCCLLLCSLFAAGCVKETHHAVVVVQTTGVDGDVQSLSVTVTVDGTPAKDVLQFTAQQATFSLQLPDGTAGEVRVAVTAQAATGCTVARGESRLIVAGIGRYDTTVGLSRLAMPNCQTMVVLVLSGVSAEVRRLAVDTMLSGAAAGTHADYPPTTQQIELPLGDAVTGLFSATVGGVGCKSCEYSRGHATLQITSPGRWVLPIPLSPLSPLQCPPAAGLLQAARYAHTATLLDSGPFAGQIVVLAGDVMAGTVASAERYDPRTGITTAAGGLQLNRYGHTATLLSRGPDRGRILVTGGYNGDWQSEAEIYDPQTGTARVIGSLRSAVFGHTATTLADGRVVVIGGHNGSGVYRTVDIFDPDSGTWMPSDDAPASEYQHSATLLADGRILVAGGRLQSSAVVASSAVFDPRAARGQMWAAAGDLMTARAGHTATLLPSGQVLVAGGYGAASNTLQSAELFLPESRTWIAAPALAQPRGGHGATLLSSGRVFFSGSMSAFLNQLRSDGELYDAGGGGSVASVALTIPRASQPVVLLPEDGVLLVAGLTASGSGSSGAVSARIDLQFPATCSP